MYTVLPSYLHRFLGFLQIGSCNDEFPTACFFRARENGSQIIGMAFGSMVDTTEYGICEVDTDLLEMWSVSAWERWS